MAEQSPHPKTKTHLARSCDNVCVVGTGGTGGYLAQGLAKLFAGYRLDQTVVLVDPDSVEEKNLYRQNFLAHEVGRPKAEALALRLNQQFGTSFSHHVGDGLAFLERKPLSSWLVVTCVDSVAVRQQMPDLPAWLDTGNGREFGQAIYGTTDQAEKIAQACEDWQSEPHVAYLPSPRLKCENWANQAKEDKAPSCADMGFFSEQSVAVNEWSALAALNILHQILIKGVVSTPAIYFDCGLGRMTPARITQDYLL